MKWWVLWTTCLCPSKICMLTHNPQCHGGGVFGRWLGHERGPFMHRISAFIKESPGHSLPLPLCEDTVKRWLSVNQGVGSHQTLNLLPPWSWISQVPELEKWMLYKPLGLWYSYYSSLNRLRQLQIIWAGISLNYIYKWLISTWNDA